MDFESPDEIDYRIKRGSKADSMLSPGKTKLLPLALMHSLRGALILKPFTHS